MAFIAWDLDPEAMGEWQNVAGRCQPGDWLYLRWGCDYDTTQEQGQSGLYADTLDIIIQRDGVEMPSFRLVTRVEPWDSPRRLFRFEEGSVFRLA